MQDPVADAAHQAERLGDGDEIVRPDQATTRMSPAQQRFETDDLVGAGFHDRLVHQGEFILVERAAQVGFEFQLFLRATAHVFGVGQQAVATLRFRALHRGACIGQQLVGAIAVFRRAAVTDACRQQESAMVHVIRFAQIRQQALRIVHGGIAAGVLAQQQGKFIHADTRHGVHVAGAVQQAVAELCQQLVGAGVSHGFVQQTEPVEVHQHHGNFFRRLCAIERQAQSFQKEFPVRQSRQRIVKRQVIELAIGGARAKTFFFQQPDDQRQPDQRQADDLDQAEIGDEPETGVQHALRQQCSECAQVICGLEQECVCDQLASDAWLVAAGHQHVNADGEERHGRDQHPDFDAQQELQRGVIAVSGKHDAADNAELRGDQQHAVHARPQDDLLACRNIGAGKQPGQLQVGGNQRNGREDRLSDRQPEPMLREIERSGGECQEDEAGGKGIAPVAQVSAAIDVMESAKQRRQCQRDDRFRNRDQHDGIRSGVIQSGEISCLQQSSIPEKLFESMIAITVREIRSPV